MNRGSAAARLGRELQREQEGARREKHVRVQLDRTCSLRLVCGVRASACRQATSIFCHRRPAKTFPVTKLMLRSAINGRRKILTFSGQLQRLPVAARKWHWTGTSAWSLSFSLYHYLRLRYDISASRSFIPMPRFEIIWWQLRTRSSLLMPLLA
jgi:hypothetical protein